ncbi:hypothetical protein G6F61_015004 [Rhizopus arrhizus]|nr:hypothetical protein G6F61_015004 [Rhizopus arrhizus]
MKISALLQMMLLMKCTVASTRALSSRRVVRTSRRLEGTGRFSLIEGRCGSARRNSPLRAAACEPGQSGAGRAGRHACRPHSAPRPPPGSRSSPAPGPSQG